MLRSHGDASRLYCICLNSDSLSAPGMIEMARSIMRLPPSHPILAGHSRPQCPDGLAGTQPGFAPNRRWCECSMPANPWTSSDTQKRGLDARTPCQPLHGGVAPESLHAGNESAQHSRDHGARSPKETCVPATDASEDEECSALSSASPISSDAHHVLLIERHRRDLLCDDGPATRERAIE